MRLEKNALAQAVKNCYHWRMETHTTKLLSTSPAAMRTTHTNGRAYQQAWERFWRISARLGGLWKSKKTTVQILREGRQG